MTDSARIDSLSKASRYLSGLGGRCGFDEALQRVTSHSSPEISDRLKILAAWIRGTSPAPPDPELALIGQLVRHAPPGTEPGPAIGAVNAALGDARELADHVRSGMAGGLFYAAALLAVAFIVASIWLTQIAPEFVDMFTGFDTEMPGFSRFLAGQAWLVFLVIAGLAAALIAIFLGNRQLAQRLETAAPLGAGLRRRVLGRRLPAAHDVWRALLLARAWTAGGGEPYASLQRATAITGISDNTAANIAAELKLASDLGLAAGELEYQALAGLAACRDAIEIWHALAIRLLQAAIAVLVGAIVIAVYLPLFSMGAIV